VVGGGHAAGADTSLMCVAARVAANESRLGNAGNAGNAGALRMPGQPAHLHLNCLEHNAAFHLHYRVTAVYDYFVRSFTHQLALPYLYTPHPSAIKFTRNA
jgi:hypothetical protein